MKTVLLDTDIGDDIDDALALAAIMNCSQLQLLTVTTVHGEVDIRSRIAAHLLNLGDFSDVPVVTGYGQPYNKQPRTGFVQAQGDTLPDNVDYGKSFPSVPNDSFLLNECGLEDAGGGTVEPPVIEPP